MAIGLNAFAGFLQVVSALCAPFTVCNFHCAIIADNVLTLFHCFVGKKLDQKVEQSIQASGVLLLTLVAVVLVVRDTINLGSGKPFM